MTFLWFSPFEVKNKILFKQQNDAQFIKAIAKSELWYRTYSRVTMLIGGASGSTHYFKLLEKKSIVPCGVA